MGELLEARPWIDVWVHGNPLAGIHLGSDRMSAEEARTLAGGLLEATDLLESLETDT